MAPESTNVQVPPEAEREPAEVVVQRGLSKSTTMPVTVADFSVNLSLHNGSCGPINETKGCYSGSRLLDFRKNQARAVPGWILPLHPNAAFPLQQYRPFDRIHENPYLAALVSPD